MKVDFSNVLKERVGEHGVSDDEIEELNERLGEVHERIQEKRSDDENGEYDFMGLPHETDAERIERVAGELRDEFDAFVNIGIGGSALGGATLSKSLVPESETYFLDNIDPDALERVLGSIDVSDTVFNVVSKSGTTAETAANFAVVREILENTDETDDWTQNIVVTTGQEGPLRRLTENQGVTAFDVPENVPGRYSALSPVGLLSAAFAGADIDAILEGGRTAEEKSSRRSIRDNPAYAIGGLCQTLDTRRGKSVSVMMPYAERLELFAEWYSQLWAESLGKKETRDGENVNAGQTPVKS
ncbi:MAG: glucose-6-phosphate isomerase, partial [Halobacteria archaeon]|nr:glucose-6-phosphate isomerase [Halobacteria archaeon]